MKERDVRPVYMGTFEIFKRTYNEDMSKTRKEMVNINRSITSMKKQLLVGWLIISVVIVFSYLIK